MKFKKLLGGGLLATVLALGVGAGLAVRSESKEADASTSETTIYIKISSDTVWNSWGFDEAKVKVKLWNGNEGTEDYFIWDHTKTASDGGFDKITIQSVDYYAFSRPSGKTAGCVYYDDKGSWAANYTTTFTFAGAAEGNNLLTVSGGSNTGPVSPSVQWGTLDVSTTVKIHKYGICDGDTDNPINLGEDSIDEGSTYAVPGSVRRDGYHFGGWFTESDCLESHRYTAQVLNDDLNLYAKFTTLSKNSYIYYLQDTATNNYVYTWGGENEFGPAGSQGSAITSVSTEVHGVLNFEGRTQYIYKIEFSSEAADTSLKFHYNNWEKETHQMQLVAGAAYWWSETIDAHNTDAGAAIDLLLKIEAARNGAEYKGLEFSVCGIKQDVAEDLIDEYDNTLTDGGRAFVDGTYTKTYDPSKSASESPSEVRVQYSLIIAKLREIADGTEPNLNTRSISLFGDIDNSTPIMLVVIISVVSLTAVGGYIFLKRRKEN